MGHAKTITLLLLSLYFFTSYMTYPPSLLDLHCIPPYPILLTVDFSISLNFVTKSTTYQYIQSLAILLDAPSTFSICIVLWVQSLLLHIDV